VRAVKGLPVVRVPRSFVLSRRLARQPRPSWTFPILRAATVTATAALVLVVAADLAVFPASQPRPGAPATVVAVAYEKVASEPQVTNAAPTESPTLHVAATVQKETVDKGLPATEAPSLSAPPPAAAAIPEEAPMGFGLGAEGEATGAGSGAGGARTGTPDEAAAAAPTLMSRALEPTASLPPPDLVTTEMQPRPGAWEIASTPQAVAVQPGELPPADAVAQYAAGRMRAIEIILAGVALVSGLLTLVSSGRLRRP
jgi:hypothetical protein